MTIYEELGISADASVEEIRRSYKRFTRIFHPDQQQDPDIRALAEVQMKRINQILAILTDPDRRSLYDESLREDARIVRQSAPHRWISRVRGNPGWALVVTAFLIVLASGALMRGVHPPAGPARASKAVVIQGDQSPGQRTAVAKAGQRRTVRPVVAAGLALAPRRKPKQVDHSTPAAGVAGPEPGPAPAVERAAVSDARKVAPSPLFSAPSGELTEASSPVSPSLAGRWVYTPEPDEPKSPRLYRASYVELFVSSGSGILRGVYRSQYKVPDRAIGANVNFTFEGAAGGTEFAWRGELGSKGEIRLRLESADTLKVEWFATGMGSALSLGEGSATLHRFQ